MQESAEAADEEYLEAGRRYEAVREIRAEEPKAEERVTALSRAAARARGVY